MNILLLEDDDALRLVWTEALKGAGHDVVDAADTSKAMSHLMTGRFDLTILDLVVGEANSLALSHYIAYAFPQTRIIVVTGSGLFPRGGVADIAPGVDWLLRKPLPVGDLLAMVAHAEAHPGAAPQRAAYVPSWVS